MFFCKINYFKHPFPPSKKLLHSPYLSYSGRPTIPQLSAMLVPLREIKTGEKVLKQQQDLSFYKSGDTLVIHFEKEHNMATANPRINITVSNEVAALLSKTAKQSKKSISKVALELIEWAIEEREDMYFSKTADDVIRSKPKFIPNSDDIWK